jgi:hypothetical protein
MKQQLAMEQQRSIDPLGLRSMSSSTSSLSNSGLNRLNEIEYTTAVLRSELAALESKDAELYKLDSLLKLEIIPTKTLLLCLFIIYCEKISIDPSQ